MCGGGPVGAVWCPAGGSCCWFCCVSLLCMSAAWCGFVDAAGSVRHVTGCCMMLSCACGIGDVGDVSCGRPRRRRNMMVHGRHVTEGATTGLKVGHGADTISRGGCRRRRLYRSQENVPVVRTRTSHADTMRTLCGHVAACDVNPFDNRNPSNNGQP